MDTVHKRVRVRGKVQGVYFRASAREEALSLRLTGLVRNEPDGSVCAEVQGTTEAVDAFIAWCGHGPERAVVLEVRVTDAPIEKFTGFLIER
jgi:acylphosphatase